MAFLPPKLHVKLMFQGDVPFLVCSPDKGAGSPGGYTHLGVGQAGFSALTCTLLTRKLANV